MEKEIETENMSLILENGDSIEVTYPTDIVEDLLNEMNEAQSKDGFWYVGNFLHALATYKGWAIDRVNMKRVIGWQ